MSSNSFKVLGNQPLQGSIIPQGAKNEALQLLCATLLTDEVVTIENVPAIADVFRLLDLLRGLGVKIEQPATHIYSFQANEIDLDYLNNPEFHTNARSIRGSVMLIGALLGRYGKAFLPKPGGDKIGRRRLDTHFLGLQQLGAEFKYDSDRNLYFMEASQLKGANILMDEISVTGTANVVLAAVMAKGTTRIYNGCLRTLCAATM